jgi:hypothetical protein
VAFAVVPWVHVQEREVGMAMLVELQWLLVSVFVHVLEVLQP